MAEKEKFLSTERCIYKPIISLQEQGEKMNPLYEKFYLNVENKQMGNKYLRLYEQKAHLFEEYLIALTPRSGSSWLTELIAKTKLAGNPEEWFNCTNIDGLIKKYGCGNLLDYIKCVKVDQSTSNNIFGLEASFYQLELALEGCNINDIFHDNWKTIYLTRNNFVKQGISLYKAVYSGYYHAHQDKIESTNECIYNEAKIKYWILHILHQEYYWENFFLGNTIQPLRIAYENLVEDPSFYINKILSYINVNKVEFKLPTQTKHKKISDKKNEEMYEQFKQENIDFIKSCEKYRNTKAILQMNEI